MQPYFLNFLWGLSTEFISTFKKVKKNPTFRKLNLASSVATITLEVSNKMFTLNVLKHVKRPNVRVNGQVRECAIW